jgi:hypothetical protein
MSVNGWFALHALMVAGVLGSAVGCTTVLYDGPKRSPSEVSHLAADRGTKLVSIDAHPIDGGRLDVYEILPGIHEVVADPEEVESFSAHLRDATKGLSLCFMAEPGQSYLASVSVRTRRVWFSVFEKTSGRGAETCNSPPASADSANGDGASSPATASRPTRRSYSRTYEDPDGDGGVEETIFRMAKPLGGFRLGLGLAFGGDDLIKATMSNGDTQTLSAGTGVDLTLGATLTPLWIANTAGFGVGASVGVKYDSVGGSNGSADLTRFPVELWAQTLLRLSPRWFLAVAGGAHKDLDVSLGSSGVASGFNASFDCPWGGCSMWVSRA